MFAAVRFVRDHCRLDPVANHVAGAIATFSDRAGLAEVGTRELAEVTGLNTQTIARAIRRLEDAGIFSVARRRSIRSRYAFPVTAAIEEAPKVVHKRLNRAQTAMSTGEYSQSAKRLTRSRALDFSGENKTHASAHDDPRGSFIPGTGWVPYFTRKAAQ